MKKRVQSMNLPKGLRQREVGTNSAEKAVKMLTEETERNGGVMMQSMVIVVKSS